MRVFFAIEFEEALKEHFFKIQQEVRQQCTAGNFTHKNNFHLTLRFIGEQNPAQVEQLKAALRETAAEASAFELIIGKLGNFSRGNRKIIWMGVKSSQALELLHRKLEGVLLKYGHEKEDRAFSPHITLGREVKIDNPDVLAKIINLDCDNSLIKVKSISLMESKRIENILCYVPLERAELSD